MSQVLPDLYPDILSRLFFKSLMRFRCVCKAWCRIIDDPAFIKLHLHRQSDRGELIFSNIRRTKHYTLSLDSLNYDSSKTLTTTVVSSPLKTLIHHDPSHIPRFHLPSCNGLILFSEKIGNLWVLWNPFTGEVHDLPSCNTPPTAQFRCIGFGYDSVADDYKVVKIGKYYNQTAVGVSWETLVYSLKSNSWRRAEDCPSFHFCTVPGVFVNGALYWMREGIWASSMSSALSRGILAFDIATEDYHFLPLPLVLSTPQGHFLSPILNALGECLLLTWYDSVYRLDDSGGKNTWTKLFSFIGMGLRNARPIAYLRSKEEVLVKSDGHVYFWFDIEKKSAKKISIGGAQDYGYFKFCQASLVRLSNGGGVDENNAAKGTSKRKRKRKRADDRLKLTLTITDVQTDLNNH